VANGKAFSEISGKRDNLARCTKIFENFLLGIFVPFDFTPGFSRILMIHVTLELSMMNVIIQLVLEAGLKPVSIAKHRRNFVQG